MAATATFKSGKHAGETIEDVWFTDEDYLVWCCTSWNDNPISDEVWKWLQTNVLDFAQRLAEAKARREQRARDRNGPDWQPRPVVDDEPQRYEYQTQAGYERAHDAWLREQAVAA